jgi:hypothetical protein
VYQAIDADAIYAVISSNNDIIDNNLDASKTAAMINITETDKRILFTSQEAIVSGGTGTAVQAGILLKKPVYVYEQPFVDKNNQIVSGKWFMFNYNTNAFEATKRPQLSQRPALIGTRYLHKESVMFGENVAVQIASDLGISISPIEFNAEYKKAQIIANVQEISNVTIPTNMSIDSDVMTDTEFINSKNLC